MTWFCGKCGTRNVADDGFCVGCGAARRQPNALVAPRVGQGQSIPDNAALLSAAAQANMHDAQAEYYRVQSLQVASQIVQPKQSTLAFLAVLCAVGGLLSVFVIGPGAALPEIVAVVLAHLALAEIRASNGQVTGAGLARASLVIGYGSMAVGILAVAGIAALILQ